MTNNWGDLSADDRDSSSDGDSNVEIADDADVKNDEGIYDERNALNDLTGKEWIKRTRSIMFQEGLGSNHDHAQIEHEHPATYPFKNVKTLIEFFTKSGEKVLDPFAGVASTQKACALADREGVGVELTKKWVGLGRKRLKREVPDASGQKHLHGDSREVLQQFEDGEFQFIVTSPPYWGILNKEDDYKAQEREEEGYETNYSEKDADLGNVDDYGDFLDELDPIFSECYRVLEEKQYIAVIVSDFRHNSEYIPFHQDMTDILRDLGFTLKGIKILVQNQKNLYPYGYPYAYVPNIHHQYIIVCRKE
jgi:DNA modification methylase